MYILIPIVRLLGKKYPVSHNEAIFMHNSKSIHPISKETKTLISSFAQHNGQKVSTSCPLLFEFYDATLKLWNLFAGYIVGIITINRADIKLWVMKEKNQLKTKWMCVAAKIISVTGPELLFIYDLTHHILFHVLFHSLQLVFKLVGISFLVNISNLNIWELQTLNILDCVRLAWHKKSLWESLSFMSQFPFLSHCTVTILFPWWSQ